MSYAVLLMDMSYNDNEAIITGFSSLALATEFARRRVRDSVEELRAPGQTPAELRRLWHLFGEDAIVLGGGYAGGHELDRFIRCPATAEERDWQEIKRLAEIR